MVLVDTSVWIRALSDLAADGSQLLRLLTGEQVVGHDLVYGELLIGDHIDRRQLLSDYQLLPHAATISHAEVVTFVRQKRLHGRGIGWIDAHLLAAALVGGFSLWSIDRNLTTVAHEFGVAYRATTRFGPSTTTKTKLI